MDSSVAALMPELAACWHPDKNGSATPESTPLTSGSFVWWRCPQGHEWEVRVKTQAKKGDWCPVCAGTRRAPIAFTHPELAATWHPTKNRDVDLDQVFANQNASHWWRCPRGHAWKSSIPAILTGKKTCPRCEKLVPRPLALTHPKVAALWHPTRNRAMTPDDVNAFSERTAWWRCDEGHVWAEQVRDQVKLRKPCPQCRLRERLPLSQTHPLLLDEWDFSKNTDFQPDHVTFGSQKKPWWRCRQGHSWQATIVSRTGAGNGCPHCRRNPEVTLADGHPDLTAQWDVEANGSLRPDRIAPTSEQVVAWTCPEATHHWTASVSSRAVHGAPCPYCHPRHAAPLLLTHPKIASYWNSKLNESPTPGQLTALSKRGVWWLCWRGHEWKQSPAAMVASQSGCPSCAKDRKRSQRRKAHV